MQIIFFIELRFWVKNLNIRYYKSYVGRNKIKNKIDINLQSFEIYKQIYNKTKKY